MVVGSGPRSRFGLGLGGRCGGQLAGVDAGADGLRRGRGGVIGSIGLGFGDGIGEDGDLDRILGPGLGDEGVGGGLVGHLTGLVGLLDDLDGHFLGDDRLDDGLLGDLVGDIRLGCGLVGDLDRLLGFDDGFADQLEGHLVVRQDQLGDRLGGLGMLGCLDGRELSVSMA